jgi:hypothetical protein
MEEHAPFDFGSCYAALLSNITPALNTELLHLSAKIYGVFSENFWT